MAEVLSARVLELRELPLFRELSPSVVTDIARVVRERRFDGGHVLLGRRTGGTCVRWVVEGEVRWERSEQELGVSRPGAPVGLLRSLAEAQSGMRAVSRGPVRLLEMDLDDLLELFEDHFPIYRTLLGAVCAALVRCPPAPARPPATTMARASPSADQIDFAERLVRLRMSRSFGRGHLRALASLARRSNAVQVRHGGRVWSAGERPNFGLLVLSGALRVGERRYLIGDDPGVRESLAVIPRTADAYAEGSFLALRIDAESLLDICEDDDDFALSFLRGVAEELWDERIRQSAVPELITEDARTVPSAPEMPAVRFKPSPLASIG